jgi:integrase
MAGVYQLKDGRWYCDFPKGTLKEKPNATREYFGRGPQSKFHANQFFVDTVEPYLRAKRGVGDGSAPEFTDLIISYLSALFQEGGETKTYDQTRMICTKHLAPFFGSKIATRINRDDMAGYIAARRSARWKHGKAWKQGIKGNTIRRELAVFDAIMNAAVVNGLITYNPVVKYPKPSVDDAVIDPPSAVELQAIIKNSSEHIRRFVLLSFYTAARPGDVELLSIEWEQVDFYNQVITIRSASKGGPAKRTVNIHPDLLPLLEEWREQDNLAGCNPTHVIHYRGKRVANILKGWTAAKRRAGIKRRLRPYDLRHASASAMLASGKDLKSVSEILGHSKASTTANVYQHVTSEQKKDAINSLPSLF